MSQARSVDPRHGRWERLNALLDRLESGAATLAAKDARELTALYRAASSDLVEEVRRDSESATSEYLRSLVGRGHGLLHRGNPLSIREPLVRFFVRDFPATVRRRVRAVALASLVFVLGVMFGAASLAADPGAGEVLLPFGHRYQDPRARVESEQTTALDAAGQTLFGTQFSAELMTHNSRVTYLAAALGASGGIGTLLMIFANGAYLGGVGADYVAAGETEFLIAWIGPHGVIEIPAMLLGAAAGLILARALFAPGLLGRRKALELAGRDAMILLGGATATLALAGIIEGTFSQMHEPLLPYPLKIAFAVVLGTAYAGYLFVWDPDRVLRLRRRRG